MSEPADTVQDPEVWDHLCRHRDRKSRCLADCLAIQAACPKDPGHSRIPVEDCKICHRKIVDRISRRYLDSPETEWYAGRRTFLQHLAELFPAVKRGEVDASGIEDRVMDEKRKWHRENVRRIAGQLAGFGEGERKEEVMGLLADGRLEFAEFCGRVREVVTRGTERVPEGALQRLMETRNDPEARVRAYREIFFFPHGEAEVGEGTRKYLQMSEHGMSMTKVAGRMVEDRRQGIADRAEVERLQSRIEYLKKAKATWVAQRKGREGDEEKPTAVPPCFRCGLAQDVADPPSCAICQLEVAHEFQEEAVVYCGDNCQRLGHGEHVAKAHKCAAGERCVTLYEPEGGGLGAFTDPTNAQDDAYVCKECMEQRRVISVFCTPACADTNYSHHRDELHQDYEPRTAAYGWEDVKTHLVTLEQALREMKEQNVFDQLSFLTKLRYAVVPPKTQPAESGGALVTYNGVKAEAQAATSQTDRMDTDTESGKETVEAAANAAHAGSIRQSDVIPKDDEVEGVEAPPAPQDVEEREADSDMLDGTDVADFGAATEPTEPQPPPVIKSLEMEDVDMDTRQDTVAATVPDVDDPPPAEQPPVDKLAEPTADRKPPHDLDPAEMVPVADPAAAERVRQPSRTFVSPSRSPSSPAKVTSIEPMPSLGESLEVEIVKLPAATEIEPQQTTGKPPPDEVLSLQRSDSVVVMDRIADEKAAGELDMPDNLRAEAGDSEKPDPGAEKALKERFDFAFPGSSAAARSGLAKQVVDKAAVDAGNERRAKEADRQDDDEELSEQQLADVGWRAQKESLNKSARLAALPVVEAAESQRSADSKEDGEISSSDEGGRKRKASSVEPGEVREDDVDDERERKKVKSVDREGKE